MITTYISSTSSPLSSQDDKVIDLSSGDTLPVNVQLYAGATDTSDPSASFSFSWHLLKKPSGSSASLDDAQLSQPVLQNVDVWGNYLLFCIATNTSSSETSERDPLAAGPSALLSVIVKSENLALVKPAPGERDWFENYFDLVDVVENTIHDELADHETRITTLEGASAALDVGDLGDVSLTSPVSSGEALVFDGTNWVNQVVSGGSGSGELAVIAGSDGGTVDLVTEALAVAGDSNITVTGSTLTAGQYTVNLALAGTLDVDTTGNAATATTASTASQLATARTIALNGDVTASGSFNGSSNLTLNAVIPAGSISNSQLENNGFTFSDGSASETLQLGSTLSLAGTANEVDVSYSSASNTFTVGLPSTITADLSGNASTASTLETSRTIALTGGATGSGSFNGSANLSIATSLRTATGAARGGVLLETGSGNANAYVLRRERLTVSGTVYATHEVLSTIDNHVTDHDGLAAESSAASNVGLRSCIVFRNPFPKSNCHLDVLSLVVGFGGETEGGAADYLFELVSYADLNAVLSNNHTSSGLTFTPTRLQDNGPIGLEVDYTDSYNGPTVGSGAYVGIFITNAPKNIGHALNAQITFSREIGA